MVRALRVCKTTLALVESACNYYLNDDVLFEKNLVFKTLNRPNTEIKKTAEKLKNELEIAGITTEVVSSKGQYGGGTLPDVDIDSYSVKIVNAESNNKRSKFAEQMHKELLLNEYPVLGILKKGNIYFDMLTIFNNDVEGLANIIAATFLKVMD